jgi:5-oxoprolinase (ATP-hydrolysing)
MTNTRITDPEVLETRYPVRLERFSIRRGTGGKGLFNGGDGLIRQYRFLEDLHVSLLTQRRDLDPLPHAANYAATAGEGLIIETPGGAGGLYYRGHQKAHRLP